MKTVSQLVQETGISRFTLAQGARKYFNEAVQTIGKTYWINETHPAFTTWLKAHPEQWRVKQPRKKKAEQ